MSPSGTHSRGNRGPSCGCGCCAQWFAHLVPWPTLRQIPVVRALGSGVCSQAGDSSLEPTYGQFVLMSWWLPSTVNCTLGLQCLILKLSTLLHPPPPPVADQWTACYLGAIRVHQLYSHFLRRLSSSFPLGMFSPLLGVLQPLYPGIGAVI